MDLMDPAKCKEVRLYERMRNMHLIENRFQSGTARTEEEAIGEFIRDYLLRRIRNAIAVIREEVPREAWPRVAARFEAAGMLPLMSDDDLAEPVKSR